MEFKREIITKIKEALKFAPVLVLSGARQTGKTTLLKELLPNFNYVSLDLPSEAERAESQPEAFLNRHLKPLLIDEVQYAPQLFRHLKVEIDKNREKSGQFVLTGSQKFNLMKEVADSLAGRCIWFELETLSASELQKGNQPLQIYEEQLRFLIRGGYPELWKKPAYPASDFYRSYVATYLERDVRQMINVGSLRDFERFIRICAAQNGRLLDKTDIAKSVGVNVKTVTAWLSVLEASGIICFLEPYFENLSKRLIKSPKLYFSDTGLLAFLLDITETIPDSLAGSFWETYVFSELRKASKNSGSGGRLWFYRDSTGVEVDFLKTYGDQVDLLECKWTELPGKKDIRNIESISEAFTRKQTGLIRRVSKKAILCRTPNSFPISGDISALNGFTELEEFSKP